MLDNQVNMSEELAVNLAGITDVETEAGNEISRGPSTDPCGTSEVRVSGTTKWAFLDLSEFSKLPMKAPFYIYKHRQLNLTFL